MCYSMWFWHDKANITPAAFRRLWYYTRDPFTAASKRVIYKRQSLSLDLTHDLLHCIPVLLLLPELVIKECLNKRCGFLLDMNKKDKASGTHSKNPGLCFCSLWSPNWIWHWNPANSQALSKETGWEPFRMSSRAFTWKDRTIYFKTHFGW